MSNILKLTIAILLTTSVVSKGQSLSSAIVSATVISPVGFIKNADIAVTESSSYAVKNAEANFTIVGNTVDAYSITLSPSVKLTNHKGAEIINANISASIEQNAGSINNKLRVNATFDLAQNQQPGLYTSKNFEVILGYN